MMNEWVRQAIEHAKKTDRKFSQAELARRMADRHIWSPDRTIANKTLLGKRKLEAQEMYAISEITGYPTPTDVTDAHTNVPIISWVTAGGFDVRDGKLQEPALGMISVGGLPPGSWFALVVDGDSMNRVAPHGSTIIANRHDTDLFDGKYYVVADDSDYSTTFKRYRADPFRLEPYSTNEMHEPKYPKDEYLRVVGRVRLGITDLK